MTISRRMKVSLAAMTLAMGGGAAGVAAAATSATTQAVNALAAREQAVLGVLKAYPGKPTTAWTARLKGAENAQAAAITALNARLAQPVTAGVVPGSSLVKTGVGSGNGASADFMWFMPSSWKNPSSMQLQLTSVPAGMTISLHWHIIASGSAGSWQKSADIKVRTPAVVTLPRLAQGYVVDGDYSSLGMNASADLGYGSSGQVSLKLYVKQ